MAENEAQNATMLLRKTMTRPMKRNRTERRISWTGSPCRENAEVAVEAEVVTTTVVAAEEEVEEEMVAAITEAEAIEATTEAEATEATTEAEEIEATIEAEEEIEEATEVEEGNEDSTMTSMFSQAKDPRIT